MIVVFLVLPLAVLVSGAAVAAFLWSVRSGQLDDLDTPALRMLRDSSGTRRSRACGAASNQRGDLE